MKMAEEENSLMKNMKRKRYKILRKKGSETKQDFETSSSSSENEKKLIDSVNISFLLEILVFNFFLILSFLIDYRFLMNLFFMN